MAGDGPSATTENKEVNIFQGLNEETRNEIVRIVPDSFTKQHAKMKEIFAELAADDFNVKETYEDLLEYIGKYDRILYSDVSHNVYNIEKEIEEDKTSREKQTSFDTLLQNLDTLLDFVNSLNPEKGTQHDQKVTRETKKAIWKLWDHINLAHRQFQELRISEGDYKKRFEEQVSAVEARMIKESTSQMLTVVGIFTALAFVAVGGISSLGGVLSGLQSEQLLKLLIVACVWGVGMLNVVFIFLFGIGKLTSKELKSNDSDKIRKRYPAYFWSNYILISLILVLGWLYYSHNRSAYSWVDGLINLNPEVVGFFGLIVLFVLIGLVAWLLRSKHEGP